jgi:hypothetical protein
MYIYINPTFVGGDMPVSLSPVGTTPGACADGSCASPRLRDVCTPDSEPTAKGISSRDPKASDSGAACSECVKTIGAVMLADAGAPGVAEAEVMDCQTGL